MAVPTAVAALPAIGAGLNAVGSLFSGISGARQARQNAEMEDRDWRYGRADRYQELAQNDRQFGARLDDDSRRYLASLGIDIDKLYQDDRQFGARQAQDDRQFAGRLDEESRQFGFDRAMQDRQFQSEFGLDRMGRLDERATNAARLQRSLNTAPLQDRAAWMLNQRLGMGPASFAQGGAAPVLDGMRGIAGSYQQGGGGMDFSVLRNAIGRMTSGADDPGAYQTGPAYQGAGYRPGPEYQAQRATTNYTPTNYAAQSAGDMQMDADRQQALSRYRTSNLQRNRNQAQQEIARVNQPMPSQYDPKAGKVRTGDSLTGQPGAAPAAQPRASLQEQAEALQRRLMPYTIAR